MWLSPIVTAEPAAEPVSRAEALAFLRVTAGADDAQVDQFITDARQHVERVTGSRLITQTVELRAGSFADLSRLPTGPISAVASISYQDPQGNITALASDQYELFGAGLDFGIRAKVGVSWPSARAVDGSIVVTATAGYGDDGSKVPAPLKRAMLFLMSQWYDNRGIVVERQPFEVPHTVMDLLTNFRINRS